MRIIQKQVRLSNIEYYKTHLRIINPFLPISLSDREIDILGAFMSLDKNIIENEIFNTYARKLVREQLNLTPGSLSNHFRSLIEKKYITKDTYTDRLDIVKYLLPEDDIQGYQFKIVKDVVR